MVKSVKKAMDILTVLSDRPESPISLQALSEQAGLNKSTCAHIVNTMCDSFFVERVSRKEGYQLGPATYILSRYGIYRQSLVNTSVPVLKWLNKQTNAVVTLAVLCNERRYIVYHIGAQDLPELRDSAIVQGYASPTATGMLLSAYAASENYGHATKRKAVNSKDPLSAELNKEAKKIRARGYAYLHDETECRQTYAFRIAKGDKTVASIGLLYPDSQNTPEYEKRVIKVGMTAAKEISRRLTLI